MTVQELVDLRLIHRSCLCCDYYCDQVIKVSQQELEKLLYYLFPKEPKVTQISTGYTDNGFPIKLTERQIEDDYKFRVRQLFEPYELDLKIEAQQWINSVVELGSENPNRPYIWISNKQAKYTGNPDAKEYTGNICGITELKSHKVKMIEYQTGRQKGTYEERHPIVYRYALPSVRVLSGLVLLYGGVSIGERDTHAHSHS